MERLYKQISDGYIFAIGKGLGGTEITQTEYDAISSAIAEKPERTGNTDYLLREDLTWEAYEVEPEEEPDIDEAEAFDIIFGGAE